MEDDKNSFSYSPNTHDHTAEMIAEELKRIFEEWGITDRIIAIVTNNAAYIVDAVRLCQIQPISCAAHTFNFVVQESLKQLTPLLEKCRAIVTHFSRSTKARDRLKQIQVKRKGIVMFYSLLFIRF